MLRVSLWLHVGTCVLGFALGSMKCPDGSVCSDLATCCQTEEGYKCCPYPNAVCCDDLESCCPPGYTCDLEMQLCVQQNKPWMSVPMVKKEAPNTPDLSVSPIQELKSNDLIAPKTTVVHCDNQYSCPDGTTCCSHPKGGWSCCPISSAKCCLDGIHCCPFGYDCDRTYTHCVREGLTYPFSPRRSLTSVPASLIPMSADKSIEQEELKSNDLIAPKTTVVHCDNQYSCPDGTTCCSHPKGGWSCCPYSSAKCCLDGIHCCPFGYDCDRTYAHCVREGLTYPFSPRRSLTSVPASLIPMSADKSIEQETPLTALTEASSSSFEYGVIRCDNKFFCPTGSSCCKGLTGQWNCCPHQLGSCCADGQHCCAYGYKCDSSSTKCTK